MKKRKVLILKKDANNYWSALYSGYVLCVAGGWMSIKRHFWNKAEWLPTNSERVTIIDIKNNQDGIWRELNLAEEKKIGFKTKTKKK